MWRDVQIASCAGALVGLLLWGAGKLLDIDALFVPAAIFLGAWGVVALLNGVVVTWRTFGIRTDV